MREKATEGGVMVAMVVTVQQGDRGSNGERGRTEKEKGLEGPPVELL